MRPIAKYFNILCIFTLASLSSCKCSTQNQSLLSLEEAEGRKILTLSRVEAFRSLDPVRQYDTSSSEIVSNVYDRLLEYHYFKSPYELSPGLLREMPTRNGDSLTYTFKLREGVYFHDDDCFPDGKGRQLVSDDVLYSIKRFSDANLNVNSYMLFQDAIVGMDDFRELTRVHGLDFPYDDHEISGIKKIDDHTFTVTFVRENPLAFHPFAISPMSIVPREAVERYGSEFERRPVGTGPFRVTQMARRGVVILERNERYWGTFPSEGSSDPSYKEYAGRQLPLVDEVRMPLIEEAQPRILSFQRGELDLVDIDSDNFENFMEFHDGEIRLLPNWADRIAMYAVAGLSIEYFRFNMRDPVVGGDEPENRALRQAIAYALDVPGFIDLILNGRALPLDTMIPHPIAGSERDISVNGFTHSLERAKEKLAEAGFPNGEGLPVLEIEYRASTTATRRAWEFHRERLSAAGIRAKANFQTFSAWLQRVERGNFQLAVSGWTVGYPDAEYFYQILYGPNTSPGPNQGNFQNARFDELYESIRYMENGPERFAKYAEMNQIIRDEVPIIPLFNSSRVGMTQQWLVNFRRHSMYFPPLKYLDVDHERKAQGL